MTVLVVPMPMMITNNVTNVIMTVCVVMEKIKTTVPNVTIRDTYTTMNVSQNVQKDSSNALLPEPVRNVTEIV